MPHVFLETGDRRPYQIQISVFQITVRGLIDESVELKLISNTFKGQQVWQPSKVEIVAQETMPEMKQVKRLLTRYINTMHWGRR